MVLFGLGRFGVGLVGLGWVGYVSISFRQRVEMEGRFRRKGGLSLCDHDW